MRFLGGPIGANGITMEALAGGARNLPRYWASRARPDRKGPVSVAIVDRVAPPADD